MTEKELKLLYRNKKNSIIKRLKEFEKVGKNCSRKEIFAELCFCLLTPQSKAELCGDTINLLVKNKFLFNGTEKQIRSCLSNVRFGTCDTPGCNKAYYIVNARKFINEILELIKKYDSYRVREWLVENIKGMGYKEASHFLRNIGLGKNIAILDRHILKNIKQLKVINKIPRTLTKSKYLEIENRLNQFSKKVNIPISHLDLLFWSKETGKIYK